MRLSSALLPCLILLNSFNGNEVFANSYRSCSVSSKIEGEYVHDVLIPLMGYFKQVNQENDEFKVEVENKNNQIKQLEENSFKLHKELESYVSRDKIIKNFEERDKSNAELISFLKQQIQALTKSIEIQTSTYFDKENNTIAKLNEKVKWDSEKLMKCETELQIKQEIIDGNVKEINDKSNEIESLKQQIKLLNNSNEQQNNKLTELNAIVSLNVDKVITRENELRKQSEVNKLKDQQILKLEREIEKSTNESKAIIVKNARNCIPYGNSSGVHKITRCNGNTFEVLCNSDIAGPGWTIIQQRVKGGVDFKRNWIEYKEGFGDFWDGDFFLGLEKIHRLTTEEPQELYIHVERFDGSRHFAKYNEFAISGEDDQYRLIKLDGFSNKSDFDCMDHNKNMKFSTYDRDNDKYHENCSTFYHGGAGWWFNKCSMNNINGIYRDSGPFNTTNIFWNEKTDIKKVRMMIRPRDV